ncbi:hypothetical protein [Luteolibacter soli]|uniref:Uncharacterized protein n=1 Tax=Luteolibacter soli TaxID=3135280 RepID=A0ABU9AV31_9BACT
MNEPLKQSGRNIGWQRFIVWMMPSCVLPFLVIGPVFMFSVAIPFLVPILLVVAIGALGYLAHYDALLQCQQREIPPGDSEAQIPMKMARFILLQLLVVPLVWCAIAFAFCAVTGLHV